MILNLILLKGNALLLLIDFLLFFSSDLWAIGIILYQLLYGKCPFKGPSGYLTFQLIKTREFELPDEISKEAQDLINKLLVLNPEDRLGAKSFDDLKAHKFFEGIDWNTLPSQTPPTIKPPQNNK